MKILVTTPTGRVGSRVLNELLAPEFAVRVITRDPNRLPADVRAQVDVVVGSMDDPTIVRRALAGVEALFWAAPTPAPQTTVLRGHYEGFAEVVSQAVRDVGPLRIVALSSAGQGRALHAGPISGLQAMEEILNQSGAAIRHLRCGVFMENLLAELPSILQLGILSYPIPGHIPIPLVAVNDIADVALQWLARRQWQRVAAVPVLGREDLSYDEVAAILGRVLERPVQYREASANQYVSALVGQGASTEYARSLVDFFAAWAQSATRAEQRGPGSSGMMGFAAWARSECSRLVRRRSGSPGDEAWCAESCCC